MSVDRVGADPDDDGAQQGAHDQNQPPREAVADYTRKGRGERTRELPGGRSDADGPDLAMVEGVNRQGDHEGPATECERTPRENQARQISVGKDVRQGPQRKRDPAQGTMHGAASLLLRVTPVRAARPIDPT